MDDGDHLIFVYRTSKCSFEIRDKNRVKSTIYLLQCRLGESEDEKRKCMLFPASETMH